MKCLVQSLGLNNLEPFPSLRPSRRPCHPALCPCSPGHPVFSLPCSTSFAYRCSDSSGKTPESGARGLPCVPSALCVLSSQHWSCCVVVIYLCVYLPIRLCASGAQGPRSKPSRAPRVQQGPGPRWIPGKPRESTHRHANAPVLRADVRFICHEDNHRAARQGQKKARAPRPPQRSRA